jgi:hypothetical protein
MTDILLPPAWDRAGLAAVGFEGFVPLLGLDVRSLPTSRGVYAALRPSAEAPVFLVANPVVRRRLYSTAELSAKWVPSATIVYLGKADPADGIRGRLGAFSRKAQNHGGGRAIWQLSDAESLLAAWLPTPGSLGAVVETAYLRAFVDAHGRFPYANWRF